MLIHRYYLKMCKALSLKLGSLEEAQSNRKLRKLFHVIVLLSSKIKEKFHIHDIMTLDARKPVFGVADQVPHKLACTRSEGHKFGILDLRRRGIVLSEKLKQRR